MATCVDRRGKKGAGGQARGIKNGAVDFSMGPARVEVCFFVQRATILNKRVILTFINTKHAINIMCMVAVLYV